MSQRLTLDPSSFETLLVAAWVLQCQHEQEARSRQLASNEMLAKPQTIAGAHGVYDRDPPSILPALSKVNKAAEVEVNHNTAGGRATPLNGNGNGIEHLASPVERQTADQERTPQGSSFRLLTSERGAWSDPVSEPVDLSRSRFLAEASGQTRAVGQRVGTLTAAVGAEDVAASGSLRHALLSLLHVAERAKNQLESVAAYQVKVRATPSLRRAVTASGAPLVLLLIVVSLSLFLVWRHGRFQSAAATSAMNHPSDGSAVRKAVISPLQTSHRQVTDRAALFVVEGLSRYEVRALRRQAFYGDASAALTMGMIYETGRYVPQSCTTAADWVTRSANWGNAAAQYNLGIRYRDGDGVPANQETAEKWLRKAAAHKYSKASLALETLISGDAHSAYIP
jgi:hypothetical protein